MTTMNYPANYAVINSEEMTYVTGGTAWDTFKNAMYVGYNIFAGPVNFFTALSYFTSAANGLEKISDANTLLGELAAIGNAVADFGYGVYYLGTSVTRPNSVVSYWDALNESI